MRSAKQNFVADIAALKGQLSAVLAMLVALANAARETEAASFTLKKFLARNQLSESQYHKLRRQGRGPRVMSVGSCGVRISREAERDWIVMRETEAETAKEIASTKPDEQPSPRSAPRATPSRSSSSHRALDQTLKGKDRENDSLPADRRSSRLFNQRRIP